MHCGSAGNNEYALHTADKIVGQPYIVEIRNSIAAAGFNGLSDNIRLLVDLLEHEVGVAALLRLLNVPLR